MTRFSDALWEYQRTEYDFVESLEELGFEKGTHYESIGWDEYDNSIEFYKVEDNVRLTEPQQKIIYDAGFSTAYVNHKDGWETHYNWKQGESFKASRGWRRRYVSDLAAETTNVIAGPANPGYYEISYWPEGWTGKCKSWLESGYMRIVPDPLEKETT